MASAAAATEVTEEAQGRRTGRCKWFNVVKGYGFITPDDGQPDVFLHQTVIQMEGFRSLAEGEVVEFEAKPSERGLEATFVCGPGGVDCKGSERRPVGKRKTRKIRCYNCGEFANHIAARCPEVRQPKRCHQCKSEEHLIAECPHRPSRPPPGSPSQQPDAAAAAAAAATRDGDTLDRPSRPKSDGDGSS